MPGPQSGRAFGRLIAGAAGVVLAVVYAAVTLETLSLGRRGEPGAALFPLAVAALLAGTGGALALEAWRGAGDEPLDLPVGRARRRLLAVGAAIVLYVVALPWLGFLLSSALFSSAALCLLGGRVGAAPVAGGLVLAVSIDAVFVRLLGVPLPSGVLP